MGECDIAAHQNVWKRGYLHSDNARIFCGRDMTADQDV